MFVLNKIYSEPIPERHPPLSRLRMCSRYSLVLLLPLSIHEYSTTKRYPSRDAQHVFIFSVKTLSKATQN
jgi:hypothetical protein